MSRWKSRIVLIPVMIATAACSEDFLAYWTIPPSPPGAPSDVEVANLIDASPCDILPEEKVLGTRAHRVGYPYWSPSDEEMQFDSTFPRRSPDGYVTYALTEGHTFENEVHDCQRLIVYDGGGTLSYGPLVALLPLDNAMNLPDPAFAHPRAIATVYNWGGFDGEDIGYPRLDIAPGWNCLWLRESSGTWEAAITTHNSQPCFQLQAPPDAAFDLEVQRTHVGQDNPETARWGWDPVDSSNIFGIKCGGAWCWIASPGFTAPAALAATSPTSLPGYYDEQHLAIPDGNGGVTPGPIARVQTSPEFLAAAMQQKNSTGDELSDDFLTGIAVATIDFPAGVIPAPYDKWGTKLPLTLRLQTSDVDAPDGLPMMRVSYRDPNGVETPYRNIHPIRNESHAAMGAVRWRWHDTANTESTWSACGPRGKDCCDGA